MYSVLKIILFFIILFYTGCAKKLKECSIINKSLYIPTEFNYHNIARGLKDIPFIVSRNIGVDNILFDNARSSKKKYGSNSIVYSDALLYSAVIYCDKEDNRSFYNFSKKAYDIYFKNKKYYLFQFDKEEQKRYIEENRRYLISIFTSTLFYKKKENVIDTFNKWLNYKRTLYDIENAISLSNPLYVRLKKELARLNQEERDYSKIEFITKKLIREYKLTLDYAYSKIANIVSYNDISKRLRDRELYIDFSRIGDSYFYFTLDKKQNITFKKINKEQTKKIELAIKTIQQDNDESSRDLKVAQEAYGKLYKLIIEPLNVEMKNKDALIISPDGMLDLVPFEAFFNQKEKRYLIQDYCIRYIPSGKEFVKLSEDSSLPNQNIVIFANSDFKSIRKNRNRGGIFDGLNEFDNLTYAIDEANSVKKYFPNSQYFLDENATEENFMKVSKPKIWHIVTHGFLSKNKNSLNPLLNCGIVLYGANESIRNKKGDGIITGLELAGMDLKGTELVVLSACLTGVGEVDNSEGVASISKAFRKAGAKYLLTTLWSIDDELTVTLMKKFYKYIKEGNMSYSKALQRAKIDLIMDISNYHPYYWAGFVGSGRG